MHALLLSPRVGGLGYLAALPVVVGLVPHASGGASACRARVEIGLLEVDAAVAAREPCLVGGVRDRIREREEELHVALETTLVVAVTVAPRNKLCDAVPVTGGKLGARTVRPVL